MHNFTAKGHPAEWHIPSGRMNPLPPLGKCLGSIQVGSFKEGDRTVKMKMKHFLQIDIVATQGRKATIAIDDITVNPGRCDMPKSKYYRPI